MSVEDKIKMPMWEKFCKDILGDSRVDARFLYIKGGRPNKVFRLATADGARKAINLMTRLRLTGWVAFSVGDVNRPVTMLATAALLHDLAVHREKKKATGRIRLYVEQGAGGPDGVFPDIENPDKEKIKAFYEEIRSNEKTG